MPDQCRPVEIDGEIIRVRGSEPLDDKSAEYFAEIYRAAKRRMADDAAAHPGVEAIRIGRGLYGRYRINRIRDAAHVHKFEVSPRTGGVACSCGERRGVTKPGWARTFE